MKFVLCSTNYIYKIATYAIPVNTDCHILYETTKSGFASCRKPQTPLGKIDFIYGLVLIYLKLYLSGGSAKEVLRPQGQDSYSAVSADGIALYGRAGPIPVL